MGPLANRRRVYAMIRLADDACNKGAHISVGGARVDRNVCFFGTTLLTDLTADAHVLDEEPFGPLAVMILTTSFRETMAEANRLPFGLVANVFTRSLKNATEVSRAIESGMLSINHYGFATTELQFKGVKESGFGAEGGHDALDSYLSLKLVT